MITGRRSNAEGREGSPQMADEIYKELMEKFSIAPEDLIEESYCDLIERKD